MSGEDVAARRAGQGTEPRMQAWFDHHLAGTAPPVGTEFTYVVNEEAAKNQGIEIPENILAEAETV